MREVDLTPVGSAGRDDLQQLLDGATRHPEPFHDPRCLAVPRYQGAGPGVEENHPYRRGFDQGLQLRSRTKLVPVGTRVGDRRRCLRRKEHEHLFVVVSELPSAFLPGKNEAAQVHTLMTDRRGLQTAARKHGWAETEPSHVAGQVSDSQRAREFPEVLEQPPPVVPGGQLPVIFRRDAGGEKTVGSGSIVDGRDHSEAGPGHSAGAVDDFAQHCVEVQARADPDQGPGQF